MALMERVKIEKIVSGGLGLGSYRGKAVFVPFVLPNEEVSVAVTQEKTSFLMARPVEILTASADRQTPVCPYFGVCGGCHYQMVSYETELALKKQVILEAFHRIGGISLDPEFIFVPSARTLHYRNRCVLNRNSSTTWAYRIGKSHDFVEIQSCCLVEEPINRVIGESNIKTQGDYILRSNFQGRIFTYPREKGREGRGTTYLEEAAGITLPVTGSVFFQVNRSLIALWLETIRDFLLSDNVPGSSAVELYSGTGLISLYLEKHTNFGSFFCFEDDPLSVRLGIKAIQLNQSEKVKFINLPSERADKQARVIIANPPRSGMSSEARANLIRLNPLTIIYSSCNPDTAARDAAFFEKHGFHIAQVRAFDFFPRTCHCEIVLMLRR